MSRGGCCCCFRLLLGRVLKVFYGRVSREQAERVHVEVVDEYGAHVESAEQIAEFALALELDAEQHGIVAQADYEHVHDLLEEIH